MAVACTNLLTGGTDTDGGSGSTTASVTLTANRPAFLVVSSRTGITANPNQPTATSTGATWVAVNSIVYDSSSTSRRRVTVLRTMVASNQTATIAIDFGGQNQLGVTWVLDEFTGADTTGTNGSGAVVQSATNSDETGTATSLTVTLAAFGDAGNATYGAFANEDEAAVATAGTGFTIMANGGAGLANCRCTSEFKNSNDTSVDMTWDLATSKLGGIGIEVKIAATVTTVIKDVIGVGVVPFAR